MIDAVEKFYADELRRIQKNHPSLGVLPRQTIGMAADVLDKHTPFASREKLEEKLVNMGWIFDSEDWQGDKTVTKRKRFTKRHSPDEIRELFTGSYGVVIDDAIPYSALTPALLASVLGEGE